MINPGSNPHNAASQSQTPKAPSLAPEEFQLERIDSFASNCIRILSLAGEQEKVPDTVRAIIDKGRKMAASNSIPLDGWLVTSDYLVRQYRDLGLAFKVNSEILQFVRVQDPSHALEDLSFFNSLIALAIGGPRLTEPCKDYAPEFAARAFIRAVKLSAQQDSRLRNIAQSSFTLIIEAFGRDSELASRIIDFLGGAKSDQAVCADLFKKLSSHSPEGWVALQRAARNFATRDVDDSMQLPALKTLLGLYGGRNVGANALVLDHERLCTELGIMSQELGAGFVSRQFGSVEARFEVLEVLAAQYGRNLDCDATKLRLSSVVAKRLFGLVPQFERRFKELKEKASRTSPSHVPELPALLCSLNALRWARGMHAISKLPKLIQPIGKAIFRYLLEPSAVAMNSQASGQLR